ncbi:MAG: hypothetical protein QNJ51_09930 [Calothrix sp. MO_167.B12]|nr:hypothetical protein [Calothrix sp. MO_167.B12]
MSDGIPGVATEAHTYSLQQLMPTVERLVLVVPSTQEQLFGLLYLSPLSQSSNLTDLTIKKYFYQKISVNLRNPLNRTWIQY